MRNKKGRFDLISSSKFSRLKTNFFKCALFFFIYNIYIIYISKIIIKSLNDANIKNRINEILSIGLLFQSLDSNTFWFQLTGSPPIVKIDEAVSQKSFSNCVLLTVSDSMLHVSLALRSLIA